MTKYPPNLVGIFNVVVWVYKKQNATQGSILFVLFDLDD